MTGFESESVIGLVGELRASAVCGFPTGPCLDALQAAGYRASFRW